ncbi:MAG: hypothetical protein ABI808_14340 [Pseudonocardiales bacterium]
MSSPEQTSPYPGYMLVPVRSPKNRVGTTGAIVTVVGALMALIGTALPWYSVNGVHVRLQDFTAGTSSSNAKPFPHAYFGWLLWVLLGLTLVAALLATLPGPLSTILRVLSPLLGVLSAFLLVISLGELLETSIYDHTALGFWAILIGFIVTGFGGVFGPRRR